MAANATAELRMGDVLRLRRRHACGASEWEVVRLGADIGLRCRGCRRRVLLSRASMRRRLADIVTRGEPPDPAIARALLGAADSAIDRASPGGRG